MYHLIIGLNHNKRQRFPLSMKVRYFTSNIYPEFRYNSLYPNEKEITLINHRFTSRVFLFIIITAIALVSCSSGKSEAAHAIEAYIQALSDKDSNQISSLSCADWEPSALIEVDSLTGVGTKVENMVCEEAGQDGSNVFISCTGALALDYNGEAQQIDLSNRTYIARQEGGEWRMCGYK